MAQSKNIFMRFWRWFAGRHKLSIDRTDDSPEAWFVVIRPWQVLMGFVAFLMLLMAAAIGVVAYTPILDMIPGMPGEKSRNLLIDNIIRLDSLEREMNNLLVYSDNISLIVDGKTPIVRNVEMVGDSINIKSKELIATSAADSALRAQIEGSGEYSIAAAAAARKSIRGSLDLLPPVQGSVTTSFDPKNQVFGVRLRVESSATVSAVKDGTIVAGYWSPDDGYVITIQHSDNLLSTYKHNSTLQKSVGAHVRAGEVIATVGDAESGETNKNATAADSSETTEVELELWYKGTPIDPEGYIVF
ncbi:MAG: M23 family metallopeptidase [Rikenellaceae bacterium]|nr:M23 family metallopeptidase [Rikenellaceae bacterium]